METSDLLSLFAKNLGLLVPGDKPRRLITALLHAGLSNLKNNYHGGLGMPQR